MGASDVGQQALAQKSQGQTLSSNKWPLQGPTSNPAEPTPQAWTREDLPPGSHWYILNWAVWGPSQVSTLPELPPLVHNSRVLFQ